MIGGIIQGAISFIIPVLKWAAKFVFILGGIVAFVAIMGLGFQMVYVSLSQSALNDIFALVQIWLPFNLNVILVWAVTGSTLFIGYKLLIVALDFMNVWLRD